MTSLKRKAITSFGLFAIFFFYYLFAALLQTPTFNHIAAIPSLGMPLGLLLSLLIFPVSWLIIAIYFYIWR